MKKRNFKKNIHPCKTPINQKIFRICTYLILGIMLVNIGYNTLGNSPPTTSARSDYLHSYTQDNYGWKCWSPFTGNFFAHYLNGNGRNSGVRVFHLNVRKLQNKVAEIKNVVKDLNPHMFSVSECELKNSTNFDIGKLKVPGYNIHFPKSWNIHGYARILLYYKKSFDCPRIHELEDDNLQTIWVKFGFKNSKAGYYCHTYREHTSNLGNSLQAQKEKLNLFVDQCESALVHGNPPEPNEIFVIGDINLDSYRGRWLKRDYHLYSLAQIVDEFCNNNNVSQLVEEITRAQYNSVAEKTDVSCIDHIYKNCRYRCSSPTVTTFGDSDHDIVGFIRLSKEPPAPTRTIRKRSYKYFEKEQFLYDLAEVDWTEVLACMEVDEAVFCFTSKFKFILDIHAPWTIFQQRKSFKPWISSETKSLMDKRDELKKKAIKIAANNSGHEASIREKEVWEEYRKIRNKINNAKRNDEAKYKKNIVDQNLDNISSLWGTVKTFMDWKSSGSPSQISKDNFLYTKAKQVADIMNEFFVEKIQKLKIKFSGTPPNYNHCYRAMIGKNCKLTMNYVSMRKVKKILKNLRSSKSVGLDELDSYSLKVAADIIAPSVHHIVTLSVMQQKFPSSFKLAKVIPLHKKLSKLDRKNYRPVSILSPLSKVLERVIYEQIYDYFSRNGIFHPNLMGFRKNRSTLTAALQMYDRWVSGAKQGKLNGVILLDLSAAFDLVDSKILIEKLKIYGMDKEFAGWVTSYLTNRKQAVWIDHLFSDWLDITVGVPQGSILGPLFFIIFANDLPHSLTCQVDSYADDSTLTSTKSTIEELNDDLNENCDIVSQWMFQNQLCLNADKTHLIITGTSQRLRRMDISGTLDIKMDGFKLSESPEKSEYLLGVHIQSDLKWTKQIQELKSRLKDRLTGLGRIRNIVPSLLLRKQIAEGIFSSILVYCMPLWGGCCKSELKQLQVIQNTAAQHFLRVPRRSNRKEMFNRLGWLSVNQLVFYHTVMTVYKMRQTGEPEYLARKMLNDNIRGGLVVPTTGLSLAKDSFCFRGGDSWISLPETIRKIEKIGKFKKSLKTFTTLKIPQFLM